MEAEPPRRGDPTTPQPPGPAPGAPSPGGAPGAGSAGAAPAAGWSQRPADAPNGGVPGDHGPVADAGNPLAIPALVLGILAVPLIFGQLPLLYLLGLAAGIAAIVLGAGGRRRVARGQTGQHRGVATAGMVLGSSWSPSPPSCS